MAPAGRARITGVSFPLRIGIGSGSPTGRCGLRQARERQSMQRQQSQILRQQLARERSRQWQRTQRALPGTRWTSRLMSMPSSARHPGGVYAATRSIPRGQARLVHARCPQRGQRMLGHPGTPQLFAPPPPLPPESARVVPPTPPWPQARPTSARRQMLVALPATRQQCEPLGLAYPWMTRGPYHPLTRARTSPHRHRITERTRSPASEAPESPSSTDRQIGRQGRGLPQVP